MHPLLLTDGKPAIGQELAPANELDHLKQSIGAAQQGGKVESVLVL